MWNQARVRQYERENGVDPSVKYLPMIDGIHASVYVIQEMHRTFVMPLA